MPTFGVPISKVSFSDALRILLKLDPAKKKLLSLIQNIFQFLIGSIPRLILHNQLALKEIKARVFFSISLKKSRGGLYFED